MLRIIKRVAKFLLGKIGVTTKYFEKDPCVIIWIDGGFCSQIFRYLKGRWFAVRGFKVKYDISWYDKSPLDGLKTERRDFILLKCFPHIELEVSRFPERCRYKFLYGTNIHKTGKKYRGHYDQVQAPLYNFLYDLDDVIANENEYEELAQYLHWEKLHDILGPEARKIEQSIIQDKQRGLKVIGLHVRRGDMSVPQHAYGGKVLTSEYYEYVINKAADKNSVIYIFSNGFDFVESEVIPHIKCKYVMVNKTSEVFEDIFLCSLCSVIIAGQGSLAKIAYSFNTEAERRLIRPILRVNEEENLPKYYAGSRGIVELLTLSENMYEH